jgi:hypothetical protein
MTKLIMAAAIAALVATVGGAGAQTYPSRLITMIAPFPAAVLRTRSHASFPSRFAPRSASRS